MFWNLFQMLLHMIHLLVAHVNLNHHLLHMHHHLVRLNLQIEVIHHAYIRLDHQTLSHFQQTVLTLMLGQMLIQGEHLLMRNLTIRSLQILHMEKNQRLTLRLWHHLMPLSGLQQNAMSLTSLLYLMFMTSLPPGRLRTGCRWVYKIKCDTEGNIILYRARIVAQGFTQCPGEEFFETFAPVAKIESIRLLLAIAAILDWEIHVIDVDSAFLNSTMPEDQTVYLSQPPGYVAEGKEDFVWKLGKALYGLKQSGHLWYQKLKGILVQIGFHACKSDPCIF